MTADMSGCAHETLDFGSGGHYIFCYACGAVWCSADWHDGLCTRETYRKAQSNVCQTGSQGQKRTIPPGGKP